MVLNFSINEFSILNTTINGKGMQELSFADVILPNEEGAPNLPGTSRYIALPNGASVELEMVNYRVETIQGVDIAPAPRIPGIRKPAHWNMQKTIQFTMPINFILSILSSYRRKPKSGALKLPCGITPFQYNPVTKELKVYRDIEIELTFINGDGSFGNERLRSRWWDPILRDVFESGIHS
ncbi:MAG: C25 family peptidase propeptide domain-containing protein [Bacteroidales bacterium]